MFTGGKIFAAFFFTLIDQLISTDFYTLKECEQFFLLLFVTLYEKGFLKQYRIQQYGRTLDNKYIYSTGCLPDLENHALSNKFP